MIIYNYVCGRLGNSLFRLFANICVSVIYDNANSIIMYNCATPCINLVINDNYFINQILNEKQINVSSNASILFQGYYQHDAIYVKYKSQIIDYILNHPNLQIQTDEKDNCKFYNANDFVHYEIIKKYKIVVHIRLEDFIEISQVINPICIKNVIDKVIQECPDEKICVVVNKPKTDIEIRYIKFLTTAFSNLIIESNDVITDFTIMRTSTILVCSCSTLSWAAALLSNSIEKIYMPDYMQINGLHQTCKRPVQNTELYDVSLCSSGELLDIL